jgi:hypothetical protein
VIKEDKREMKMETDGEIMARFYNESGVKLSKNDKFLREYILNDGWKEGHQVDETQFRDQDEEEDKHENEADVHEQ